MHCYFRVVCVALVLPAFSHGIGAEGSWDFEMASLGDDGDFTGKVKLPLPDRFSGQPSDWEEWSWNFKAYLAMFDSTSVSTLERIEENPTREITDGDMTVMLEPWMLIKKQLPKEYFSPGNCTTF